MRQHQFLSNYYTESLLQIHSLLPECSLNTINITCEINYFKGAESQVN